MTVPPLKPLVASARSLVREMVRVSPRETGGCLILLVGLTVTEGAGVLLLAPLLQLAGVVEDNPLPQPAGWLEAAFAMVGLEPTLVSVLLLFVVLAASRSFFQRLQGRLNATMREELTTSWRLRLFQAFAGAQWRFLASRAPASFVHVLTNEAARIGGASSQIIDLAVALMISLLYLALAIRLSPPMAALVLGCGAVLSWVAAGTLARSRAAGALAVANRAKLFAAMADYVGGIKTAKSYGTTARHEAEVRERLEDSERINLDVAYAETELLQTLELGSTVLLAVIVYASVAYLFVPSPLLLVLMFIFARLMPRMVSVYRHLQGLALALHVFDSVERLERECRAEAEPPLGGVGEVTLQSGVRFDGVSFAYLNRDTDAVSHLDLDIRAGVTTALVGASGSGKSTVADLLIGLLTPSTGRILIDGRPLTGDTLASWRRQIGYVPQDTFLFHATVRDNLVWAVPQATEADLWDALKHASADVMVAGLPKGLDTVVGERGVLLSGGERQRLAIARALLRRPRVLVLDEATSAIDSENEQRIQQAIEGLHHQMTIVVITHRLSAVRDADMIHVMDRGRIVESGTWDTLQANPAGRFRVLNCL